MFDAAHPDRQALIRTARPSVPMPGHAVTPGIRWYHLFLVAAAVGVAVSLPY